MFLLPLIALWAYLIYNNVEIFKSRTENITKTKVLKFPIILFIYWLAACFFALLFVSEPMVYTDELSQTMIDNEALGTVSTLAVGTDLTPDQNFVLYKQMQAKDFLTWTFVLGIICLVIEIVGVYKKNIRKELMLLPSFFVIILSSVLVYRTGDAFVTFLYESINMKSMALLGVDDNSVDFSLLLVIPVMLLMYLYKYYFVLERYLTSGSLLDSTADNTKENSAFDNWIVEHSPFLVQFYSFIIPPIGLLMFLSKRKESQSPAMKYLILAIVGMAIFIVL